MSVIDRLSSPLGIRGDVPNQELARELAETGNRGDIDELARNLFNRDKAIRGDCLKVLYETGYIRPELIFTHASDFLKLLKSRNNRLVWGAMIALSTIAGLEPDIIYEELDVVIEAMEKGSVITVDNAVSVLAKVSSARPSYERRILPLLIHHLERCRPKEIPQHSERCLAAVNNKNREEFKEVLLKRLEELTGPQITRVNRVLKKIEEFSFQGEEVN